MLSNPQATASFEDHCHAGRDAWGVERCKCATRPRRLLPRAAGVPRARAACCYAPTAVRRYKPGNDRPTVTIRYGRYGPLRAEGRLDRPSPLRARACRRDLRASSPSRQPTLGWRRATRRVGAQRLACAPPPRLLAGPDASPPRASRARTPAPPASRRPRLERPVISHQSSVISHQSSDISHQSSDISHQTSVISITPSSPGAARGRRGSACSRVRHARTLAAGAWGWQRGGWQRAAVGACAGRRVDRRGRG